VLGEQNTMGEEDMTHMIRINPHTNAQRLYWGLRSAASRAGLSWGVIRDSTCDLTRSYGQDKHTLQHAFDKHTLQHAFAYTYPAIVCGIGITS